MSLLNLRVASVQAEARDVLRLELADPQGGLLPAFTPGAHLTLHLPNGLQRQYSLAGDSRERNRYVLGVGRAADSRGGSDFVHAMLRAGTDIQCSAPANNFALLPDAPRYLFVAGGIGITPILSMVRWCEANGKPWKLVYAARSRVRMGFYEELRAFGSPVRFHCDDEHGAPLAVPALLSGVEPGTHVYCCGPAPLMEAVREHGAHLGADALHFEWFSAPAANDPPAAGAGLVLGDRGPGELRCELVGDAPAGDVDGASGREADDHLGGLEAFGPRLRGPAQQEAGGGALDELAARQLHEDS